MARRLRTKDTANKVGYGVPPLHTRFRPGQSGNPKGRPKGALNLTTVWEHALRQKVLVTEGGRRKSMSKLVAAVTQIVNKAATGDPRALQLLINVSRAHEAKSRAAPEPVQVMSEADDQVMQNIVERIRRFDKEEKE